MFFISWLFWAGIAATFLMAAGDCLRWPRQMNAAWRRFQPVAGAVTLIAAGFFFINLARLGESATGGLGKRAFHLLALAAGSSIFYCGGWHWVASAGHVGLFERIRRRMAGLPTPSAIWSLVETIAIVVGVVLFSWYLFRETQAAPSATFRKWMESRQSLDIRSGYLGVLVLVAPLWEETAFRWYLLNRLEEALARRSWGRWVAIVGTSALWASGHVGMTDPGWVKLAQIFTVGCVLSWRFRHIGLPGCVLAHLAMNSMAVFSLPTAFR